MPLGWEIWITLAKPRIHELDRDSHPHVFATTTVPAVTEVRTFEPFSPTGLNGDITVGARASGSCFGASIASSRPDAWRCTAGNLILDPCFASPFEAPARQLACPDLSKEPPTTVTLLKLSAALPFQYGNPSSNSGASPFLFVLVDGESCTLITGATGVIAGQRINGGCSGGTYWVGAIDTGRPIWSVLVGKSGSSQLVRTDITLAWN